MPLDKEKRGGVARRRKSGWIHLKIKETLTSQQKAAGRRQLFVGHW